MATPPTALRTAVRTTWLDLLARRRRWLVAALLGVGVLSGIHALEPPAIAMTSVWVAARDLPGGEPLGAGDVVQERLPTSAVPEAALTSAAAPTGRLLAAPRPRGDPITRFDLLDAELVQAVSQGDVAAAVHVADAGSVTGLVRPGERIDVLATPLSAEAGAAPGNVAGDAAGSAVVVARHLTVLGLPPVRAADGDGSAGATVIVAVSPLAAASLAADATSELLSVVVDQG